MIYHNVKKAEKYARDVINGNIITNKWIKLACQRHFGDKELSKNKDYPYKFDPAKAERVAKFIQLLPHTKGEWARRGEKIHLEPWQLFACCLPFGWVKKSDGLRRYRKILIFVCRKNGKSAIAAGLANYMFCADGEFGAEVYSGATTEKQAWEVFRPAKIMVERTPQLKEYYGVAFIVSGLAVVNDCQKLVPLSHLTVCICHQAQRLLLIPP